ncbi:MAG: hypothetical protein FJZ58_02435 [Chlamydiae bacterium]|nr:hypothetical protein [Chlamydiota bacterium]
MLIQHPPSSDAFSRLLNFCEGHTSKAYPLHSRTHAMHHPRLFVKRDDELSFGVSGSKLRKYASLLPWVKPQNRPVALVGALYSNHILSLVQLLKQECIPYYLFLKKTSSSRIEGNAFLLSLLTRQDRIFFLDEIPHPLPEQWKASWESTLQTSPLWIPLGAAMPESLPGALSLPLDIVRNEQELDKNFSSLFVDAGTGLTAIALLLGVAFLRKKVHTHVVLISGTAATFSQELAHYKSYLEKALQEEIPLPSYSLSYPVTAKSFGSCNQKVLRCIEETAAHEGIFLDPIYTAKLLLSVYDIQKHNPPSEDTLWIHSGGGFSLFGYRNAFSKNSQLQDL